MIYFYLVVKMENQINIGDQNAQQTGQNVVSQPMLTPEKPKTNYLLMVGIILVCFVLFGFGGYYLGKQSINNTSTMVQNNNLPGVEKTNTPTQTNYPTATPTVSPITQKQYGPESLWFRTEGKGREFLDTKVYVSVPTGLSKIDCGDSYNFNPIGGVNDCATEPNAFAINMFPDSPYLYEVTKRDTGTIISNLKQNLSFGGKKAVQFDEEITEGPAQGKYKETVIFYSDDAYLYVVLNKLAEELVYQELLNNIKFK